MSEMRQQLRFWSFITGVLSLLALGCGCSTSPSPPASAGTPTLATTAVRVVTRSAQVTPTLIEQGQSLPAFELDCWEYRDDGLAPQRWPRATVWGSTVVRIVPDGLVTDGDLLWISTQRGLIRLNVRTSRCVIFTKAAQVSLAGAYLLLPDGTGGLWAGTDRGLLRFSDGRWQVAYRIPESRYPSRLRDVGLSQSGDWCVVTDGGRTNWISHFCFRDDQFPLTGVEGSPGPLDLMDCERWQRAAFLYERWLGWDGGAISHYVTPDGCEQIAAKRMKGYSCSAMSPQGDEMWAVKDGRLFHRHGERAEEIELPYVDVHALASDPVYGGVWMATEYGLVHAQASASATGAPYLWQPFSFNPGMLALSRTCPYLPQAMALDRAGRTWAVTSGHVLYYDEADQAWREAASMAYGPSAIAADPVRGVWVAGREELLYWDGAQWHSWPMPVEDTYLKGSTALVVGATGRLWVGRLHTGVWTAVPTAQPGLDWRQFTVREGLANGWITALAQGSDGRIYAGHYAGVSLFDPATGVEHGRWTTLPGSADNGTGWVNALALAPSQGGDRLWVGYHAWPFLRSYEDGRWTDYRLPFATHSIGALLVDDDGALWVGSAEGLWRWSTAGDGDSLRQRRFAPDLHGPFVREIWDVVQDDAGRIWVAGKEGVATLENSPSSTVPATGCDAFAGWLAQAGHPNVPRVQYAERPVLDPLPSRRPQAFHHAIHTLFLDLPVARMTARAGFDSVVQVFPWRDLNPAPGLYAWNAADDMVRVANTTGLELVVRLDMAPDWAIVDEGPLPFDLAAYADFVAAVATRYRGRVLAYVVWNEPNLAVEWGRGVAEPWAYVGVLGAAYRRIRAADPDALVVAAGLAPTNENSERALDDRDFLRGMYQVGVTDCFDVLAAHDYGYGLPPDDPHGAHDGLNLARLVDLRHIMRQYGDDKPIWITELGYTVQPGLHPHVTPAAQADYLVGAFERVRRDWPWVGMLAVWNLSYGHRPDDAAGAEMAGFSVVHPDLSPRLAYYALQALAKEAR